MNKILSCMFRSKNKKNYYEALEASVVSVLCIFVAFYINSFLSGFPDVSAKSNPIIELFKFIIILLDYALAMFAPAIWFGCKSGLKTAVISIVFEAAWLFVIVSLSVFYGSMQYR